MTSIPAQTTDLNDIPIKAITNLVIVNDTGSTLHYFPDANGVYADHTGKEFTTYIIDRNGDEHSIYCGNIVYAGNPNNETVPTPSELIDQHETATKTGDEKWGYIA